MTIILGKAAICSDFETQTLDTKFVSFLDVECYNLTALKLGRCDSSVVMWRAVSEAVLWGGGPWVHGPLSLGAEICVSVRLL